MYGKGENKLYSRKEKSMCFEYMKILDVPLKVKQKQKQSH